MGSMFTVIPFISAIPVSQSLMEIYNMIGQKLVVVKTHNEPLYQIKIQAVTGYYIVKLTNGQKAYTEKIFVK